MAQKETRFERLLREGRGMTSAQWEEGVRWLLMQEQAPGLLGWLASLRDEYLVVACDQRLADSHGKQSHALGSCEALRVQLELMRGIV